MDRRWRRLAGQVLMVGFEGTTAPVGLLERIAAEEVGGVILFGRNIEGPAQGARLTRQLRRAAPAGAPLLIGVDQEGGRVQRLRSPMAEWPPMRQVARRGGAEAAGRLGRALGADLAHLGFNLDFAPVLDVVTSPENSVIGDRSFGPGADLVSACGLALARGLLAGGVLPCGKHFPGHGGPVADSHLTLPVDRRPRPELEALDLRPFSAAVGAGLPLLMSAHVLYPALDAAHPGTLSRAICTDLLRGELGYRGVLTSDDMEMGAITEALEPGESALAAVAAGVDLLLFCHPTERQHLALEALAGAARESPATARLLEQAGARLAALRQRLPRAAPPPPEAVEPLVAAAAHRELLEELGALP